MLSAKQLIQHYNLQPHPEGGFYAETYRSAEVIEQNGLPERFSGSRAFSTAIYFLLQAGDFSAFHKIKSDECWHFYAGDPLLIHLMNPHGQLSVVSLGNKPSNGEHFQFVVPAGYWFASEPAPNSKFSFVGCTVAPGFDFADFEMGQQAKLMLSYPQHASIFQRLCRP